MNDVQMKNYKILVDYNTIREVINLFKTLGYVPYNDANWYIERGATMFYAEYNRFLGGFGSYNKYVVEYSDRNDMAYFKASENIEIDIVDLRNIVLHA